MKKLQASVYGAFLIILLALTGCSSTIAPESQVDLVAHAEQCDKPVIDRPNTPLFDNPQDVEQAINRAEEETGADVYVRVFSLRDGLGNYNYLPWIVSACPEWTKGDGVTPKDHLIVLGIEINPRFSSPDDLYLGADFYLGENYASFQEEQFENIRREYAQSDLTASTVTSETVELLNNIPLSLDNPSEYTHVSGEDMFLGIIAVMAVIILLCLAFAWHRTR